MVCFLILLVGLTLLVDIWSRRRLQKRQKFFSTELLTYGVCLAWRLILLAAGKSGFEDGVCTEQNFTNRPIKTIIAKTIKATAHQYVCKRKKRLIFGI